MKLKQIAIATALVGSLSLAQAGDKGIGDGTLPEFLEKFDTNEDGVIDEEERQAIKELRKERREERRDAIDTDGDGEISDEEKEAARAAIDHAWRVLKWDTIVSYVGFGNDRSAALARMVSGSASDKV